MNISRVLCQVKQIYTTLLFVHNKFNFLINITAQFLILCILNFTEKKDIFSMDNGDIPWKKINTTIQE